MQCPFFDAVTWPFIFVPFLEADPFLHLDDYADFRLLFLAASHCWKTKPKNGISSIR